MPVPARRPSRPAGGGRVDRCDDRRPLSWERSASRSPSALARVDRGRCSRRAPQPLDRPPSDQVTAVINTLAASGAGCSASKTAKACAWRSGRRRHAQLRRDLEDHRAAIPRARRQGREAQGRRRPSCARAASAEAEGRTEQAQLGDELEPHEERRRAPSPRSRPPHSRLPPTEAPRAGSPRLVVVTAPVAERAARSPCATGSEAEAPSGQTGRVCR